MALLYRHYYHDWWNPNINILLPSFPPILVLEISHSKQRKICHLGRSIAVQIWGSGKLGAHSISQLDISVYEFCWKQSQIHPLFSEGIPIIIIVVIIIIMIAHYTILYIPRFMPSLLTKAFLRLLVYELPEAVLAPLRGEGPQLIDDLGYESHGHLT